MVRLQVHFGDNTVADQTKLRMRPSKVASCALGITVGVVTLLPSIVMAQQLTGTRRKTTCCSG
jgi:hypothetical protein